MSNQRKRCAATIRVPGQLWPLAARLARRAFSVAGVESGGASPWEVVLAVVNVVRKDPLAPLSSVRKLFISGRAVRWLSLAQVAAEMIDRTHHLRVLVAFDRLRWVRKANERFALQAEDKY